ncbi:GlcNAc-PI synthesis protein [Aphelenchoides bicaudatus]|nr:GlcNAc-PI synthesis protein [Aphelenchoides bicaudatus]
MKGAKSLRSKKPLRIALVSDFFCPNTGGIETHLYHLGGCLLKLGHYVVVITHVYGERRGIRYLSNGLKVYHLPFFCLPTGVIIPSVLGSLYWYRKIFLKEQLDIVHGHSTFSSIAHEAMLQAWCMGIPTVFTDHSLLGVADFHAILINKLLLSKENTALRAGLDPHSVYVIPNAINAKWFKPGPPLNANQPTTIIVISRLVYRKGADLLVDVIPEICQRYKNVKFIIGGDGPKRVDLEEMREQFNLHSRVEMCGMLPHSQVREVLIRGHIFLNTSLTEAFGTSLIEAAACGLHVVSTRVGGIPEVLPDEFVTLAEPHHLDIVDALSSAIERKNTVGFPDSQFLHETIAEMYQWEDVSTRTLKVYESISSNNMAKRRGFRNYWNAGWAFGLVWIFGVGLNLILLFIYDLFDSRENYQTETKDSSSKTHKKSTRSNGIN